MFVTQRRSSTVVLLLCLLACGWQSQSLSLVPRSHHNQRVADGAFPRRRRQVLSSFILVAAPAFVTGRATPVLAIDEEGSRAGNDNDQKSTGGLVSADRVGDLLRAVPTFTIVDPKGVPYVVVGEDAKVTGYFFTTYGEASRLLSLAKKSADRAIQKAKAEGEILDEIGQTNPWSKARVSSVPLDFAVTLASKSTQGAYFKVAPAEEDIDDALIVTGKTAIPEGKVPLFYFEDFVLDDENLKRRPLYFRKSQLLNAWKQENKGSEPPKVQVTELFRVLTKMVEAGGTDQDLKEIVFVAPDESASKAKQCNRGKGDPFLLGQRIVVL
jgi:Tic22-like family